MNSIPENLIVHVIVTVAKAISHAGYEPPGYGRIGRAQLSRKAVYCFADYFQRALQRQRTLPVRLQVCRRPACAEILSVSCMLCDKVAWVSRLLIDGYGLAQDIIPKAFAKKPGRI